MAIYVNDICPKCGQTGLVQISNELRCSKCGYTVGIFDTEDSLWLKEYNASVKWDNSLFDDLPAVIGHEYFRLKWMLERGKVYATIMQMKDVYEVTMKFAVLCAAAEVRQPTLTAQLVRGNLSVGTWEQILGDLCKVKNRAYVYEGVSEFLRTVMSSFKTLIDNAGIFGSGRHFSTWRNEFLGHGALGFSAGEKYKTSLPKMAEGLAKHFAQCREQYKTIAILLDGQPMSYKAVQNHRTIGEGALAVSVGGKVIAIDPFMLRKNDGIYFFDDYKNHAFALNYINANKCGYHAPYLSGIHERMKHEISEDAAHSDLTADFTKEQLEHEFNRLNEAYHFVKPQYITDWLTGCLYDQTGGRINEKCLGKGVLHLMMERGMGKTSYAYALDTQYGGDGHIDLSDTVVRVFYCSRIQLRSVQEFADGIRNELRRGAEAHNGKDFPVLVYEKNAASTTNARHMAKFLNEFRHIHADELQNGRRLLLVLDGLDEIPQDCAEIFDFIPDGGMLADDCYLLLTSRNPQIEQLAPAIASRIGKNQPDSRLSVVRGSEENRAVLRRYIANMTKNADEEFRLDVDAAQTEQLIDLADDTFLNLTMYLQLVRSGIGTDQMVKMSNAELLQFYMDRVYDVYGDKLFGDALKVLAVVLTAQEPLTVQEIAALSGRGDPDLMLLAYMKDLAPFMKCIHAGEEHGQNRGANTYASANAGYAAYITEQKREVYDDTVNRYTQMLLDFDCETSKDEKGMYHVPDEITYIAAHIGEYWDSNYLPDNITDILEKINIIMATGEDNSFYLIERRIKMGIFQGDTYAQIGHCDKSINAYSHSIVIAHFYIEINPMFDITIISNLHNSRGTVYTNIGMLDKAKKDYDISLAILESIISTIPENERVLATIYHNKANLLQSVGCLDECISNYSKCIAILESLHEAGRLYDENDLAREYNVRGQVYGQLGMQQKALSDFDRAEVLLWESFEKGTGNINENELANTYIACGNTYFHSEMYENALSSYSKGITILDKLLIEGKLYDLNQLSNVYMSRAIIYSVTGKYEEALKDYGKCIAIRESLHEAGKLYDINDMATPLLNKGILLANGLHDTQGALAFFNHAIALLEAEQKLSYSANDTLRRLCYQRDKLTANLPSAPAETTPSAPAETTPPKKKGFFGKLFGKK